MLLTINQNSQVSTRRCIKSNCASTLKASTAESIKLYNKMEENIFNRLVYLDHNILDQMTKGDPRNMKKIFESGELIVVYSNENLNEIKRSEGYENSFLEVLTNIKARYIVPNMDHKFRYIGTAQVHERDPIEAYNSYLNEVDEMPEYGYGMSGMLQKMYGGLVDQSFSEILAKGSNEIGEMLQIPDEDIDGLDIDDSEKIIVKNYLKMLPGILNQRFSDLGSMLDKNAVENSVKELERTTGIGPKVLKNISSPNTLSKIWDHAKEDLNGANITLEKFFGLHTYQKVAVHITEYKYTSTESQVYLQIAHSCTLTEVSVKRF